MSSYGWGGYCLGLTLWMIMAGGWGSLVRGEPPQPITQQESEQIAKRLLEALEKGDQGLFESLVDEERYVSIAIKGYRLPEKLVDSLKQTSIRIQPLSIIFEVKQQEVAQGGTFAFLRILPASDHLPPRLLYRVVNRNGRPSYVIWWLDRLPNGEVLIYDCTDSHLGFSHTENLLPYIEAKQAEQSLPNLSPAEQECVDFLRLYSEGKKLIMSGKHGEAVAKFDAIAPRFREIPLTRLVRLDALEKIDVDRAFREMDALSQEEACCIPIAYRRMQLALLTFQEDSKPIPEVIQAIERLEGVVQDPFLAVLKAGMLVKAEKFTEAKRELQRAMENVPGSRHLRMSYVSACLQEGDYRSALPELNRLANDEPDWVEAYFQYVDGYAKFMGSEEGKAWQASRKRK